MTEIKKMTLRLWHSHEEKRVIREYDEFHDWAMKRGVLPMEVRTPEAWEMLFKSFRAERGEHR